jgi:hypothetical protein
VGRREASAQRSARAAPRWVRTLATRLSAFRFLAFSSVRETWLKARIVRVPATTAGILWRRSVRRAEKFLRRDEDSGADRIARTIRRVIAGLDPAISMIVARLCHINRDDRDKPGHDNPSLFDIVKSGNAPSTTLTAGAPSLPRANHAHAQSWHCVARFESWPTFCRAPLSCSLPGAQPV